MVWNYKIDLQNEGVFKEIEEERGIEIPNSLKDLIREANAGTPEKYNYVIGNTEKVIGAVLSFNRGENDTDTVFTALKTIEDSNLLPFAIDPFGNYLCMAIKENVVVFWDHETGEAYSTGLDLAGFLNTLY